MSTTIQDHTTLGATTRQHLVAVGRYMHEVRMSTLDATRSMNTTVGSEGGFAVPEDEMKVLTDVIFERSYLLNRVRRFSTKRSAIRVVMPDETAGGEFAGIEISVIPEMGEYPLTLLKTREAQVGLHKDGCAIYASEEMTEDGDNSFALLGESVAIAIRRNIERIIWRGSGGGQGLGVTNAPSLLTQAIESGQNISNTAQYIGTNAAKMVAQLLDMESAAFYVNPDLLTALLLATVNSNEKTVLTPPDVGAPFGRIATRPMFPNYSAPAVGTVGDFVAASMSDYAVATKGDVRSDMSIHVHFLKGENVYRFSIRWDAQPLLSKAYAPEWSTAEKSHYVALAART